MSDENCEAYEEVNAPQVESNILVIYCRAAMILNSLIMDGPDFDPPWPPTS